jgi:hypothetical protein
VSNPCNHDLCAEEAMCVIRSREEHRCICPDGLMEVQRRSNATDVDGITSVVCRPQETTTPSPTQCPLNCVKGECKFSPLNGFKCVCNPLYEGKLCDKYRCSQYCKNKGFCVIDTLAPTGPNEQKPIKVRCLVVYFKIKSALFFFWLCYTITIQPDLRFFLICIKTLIQLI